MTNQREPYCVGIDLGTTYSSIAYFSAAENRAQMINTTTGGRATPSHVSLTYLSNNDKWLYMVGESAVSDVTKASLYDSKRFIGKNYSEYTENEEQINEWPFSVVEDKKSGNIKMETSISIRRERRREEVHLLYFDWHFRHSAL